MTKDEFKTWLGEKTTFCEDGEDFYKDLVDYAEYIYDEISLYDDHLTFSWEEWYFGGIDYKTRDFTFEEFVEQYTAGSHKY